MSTELVMDTRVVWDMGKMREIDEAKATIRDYRSQGYEIVRPDGSPLERFMNIGEVIVRAKKIGGRILRILCEKGDERLTWDRENGNQALEAKAKFVEFMGKGYMAFSVDSKGKKNVRIEEFDVDAEEILMVPPTAKG